MLVARMFVGVALFFIATQIDAANLAEAFYDDANLHDVFFVDTQTGWCVGDHGVILHTIDAGTTWHRQFSPEECSLQSVFFVDARTGWVVGGRAVPYTDRSESVLLRTDDGGSTWKRVPTFLIPWLGHIEFFDRTHGVACGHASSMYPTGIVTTNDGGLTWTGVRGRISSACRSLDMVPHRYGFGVTSTGKVFSIENGNAQLVKPGESEREATNSSCLTVVPTNAGSSNRRMVTGGRRGMLRSSTDGGQTWQVSNHVAGPVDIKCISSNNSNVWACGTPGNVILRSSDAGVSWKAFRLENDLPLSSICFVDDTHGWAVGSMGTILHTHDGGRTWINQRARERRAALMVVTSDLRSMPWEQLADLSAIEGFRTVLISLNHIDSNRRQRSDDWRFEQAATSICADTAITLHDDSRAIDFASMIQIWKPDAVLLHGPDNVLRDKSDLGSTVQQYVLSAIRMAESKNNRLNLDGHTVKRFARFEGDRSVVLTERLAIGLGTTTFELASRARSVFDSRHRTPASSMTLFLLAESGSSTVVPKPKNLISAASQVKGGPARRLEYKLGDDYRHPQASVLSRRNIRAIANADRVGGVAKSSQLLHQLSAIERSDLMFELACQAERAGDYLTAISMLERIVIDTPNHRLADAAAQLLLAFKASAEVEVITRNEIRGIATTVSADGVAPITEDLIPGEPVQKNRKATFEVPSAQVETVESRLAELTELQKTRPGIFFSPRARFPLAALQRRTNQTEESLRFYRSQLGNQSDFSWRAVAASELGLADKKSPIVKPLIPCQLVDAKPYLDGVFDDSTWGRTRPVTAQRGAAADAEFRVAFDDEFLYLAVECPKISAFPYVNVDTTTRGRDVDMHDIDHVRIRIDCDRDYATYWEFSIDCQGNGREQLNDNLTWNPVWYIAKQSDESAWRVEAAIHLDQLCTQPPQLGDAWGIEFARISTVGAPALWPDPKINPSSAPQDFGLVRFGIDER